MFSIQPVFALVLTLTMEFNLISCGMESTVQPVPEAPEPIPGPSSESSASGLAVTQGTETYQGFLMDNVLHAPEGDIHYHIYIPDRYDGGAAYDQLHALYPLYTEQKSQIIQNIKE